MKKIVINDPKVFIDLQDVGLLEQFFHLPWEVHTTDFVMLELLNEGQRDIVDSYEHNGYLHVATFGFEEVIEIDNLHKKVINKTNLSLTDCSVWYYAKRNNYTLLTGYRKLCNSMLNDGVEVRGIIYVFDELVTNEILSVNQAADKLALLKSISPYFPDCEIEKHLKLWADGQREKGGCKVP